MNNPEIIYLCDMEKDCCNFATCGENWEDGCFRTSDITHAKNFVNRGVPGKNEPFYVEVSRWSDKEYEDREPYPNRYRITEDNGCKMLECPKCKCRIQAAPFSYAVGNYGYKFCPYCGEDMRKEADNE